MRHFKMVLFKTHVHSQPCLQSRTTEAEPPGTGRSRPLKTWLQSSNQSALWTTCRHKHTCNQSHTHSQEKEGYSRRYMPIQKCLHDLRSRNTTSQTDRNRSSLFCWGCSGVSQPEDRSYVSCYLVLLVFSVFFELWADTSPLFFLKVNQK